VHISIRSVLAVPVDDGVPRVATLRLGTINPAPLLMRLQKEGIQYSFGNALIEGE
jgi:acetoin utilization protein AcuB